MGSTSKVEPISSNAGWAIIRPATTMALNGHHPWVRFSDRSHLLRPNPPERSYGCAIVDADGDGRPEILCGTVAGPNRLFKSQGRTWVDVAPAELADAGASAIGVAAADANGDGRMDFYILNTSAFAGPNSEPDRLFINLGDGRYEDVMARHPQRNLAAGRSVAWLDVLGDGQLSAYVCNYGAPNRLYFNDGSGNWPDRAPHFGLHRVTGGRGLVCQDILGGDAMDIFCVNENDANTFFRNTGGKFVETAAELGLTDPETHGRGVAVIDARGDGRAGLVYGNWEGPHRFMAWERRAKRFVDLATPDFAQPSRIRTVIVADFDNDGLDEIFMNNLGQTNRMFKVKEGGELLECHIPEAEYPEGAGTGASVGDLDGDGFLDLFVAHGESAPQPNALLFGRPNGNHWLRIHPRTAAGAPAIGAKVTVTYDTPEGGRQRTRWIDGGSGYLCQMEPVAHFGLGPATRIRDARVQFSTGEVHYLRELAADQNVEARARA